MNTSFLNPLRSLYHWLTSKDRFKDSGTYWKDRYKGGGDSGWGSYSKFAQFKAEVINSFIQEKEINSVLELGCGDGNQCKLFKVTKYIGIDISEDVIKKNKEEFKNDPGKEFYLDGEEATCHLSSVEASLSLDVIYHLVEDDVFEKYMRRLFKYAEKYVIIYSSDFDQYHAKHVRNRKFTLWIETNKPEWKLIAKIPNIYPYNPAHPEETSWADFFIFENTDKRLR